MDELLLTLGIGVACIVVANLALLRYAQVSAEWAGAVTALASIGIYVPYAILRWPGGDTFAIHLTIYLLTSLACGMLLGQRGTRLHWAPALLMGFFIVVATFGAIFIAVAERGAPTWLQNWLFPPPANQRQAVSMFPGVIAHDFHKKEALYNAYLEQVERQRQRGWQVQKGWVSEAVAGEAARFRVAVHTREGAPLSAAVVDGQFLRTATSKLDVDFQLPETATPGVYEAPITLPAAGRWNLVLNIRKGADWHELQASTEIAPP